MDPGVIWVPDAWRQAFKMLNEGSLHTRRTGWARLWLIADEEERTAEIGRTAGEHSGGVGVRRFIIFQELSRRIGGSGPAFAEGSGAASPRADARFPLPAAGAGSVQQVPGT